LCPSKNLYNWWKANDIIFTIKACLTVQLLILKIYKWQTFYYHIVNYYLYVDRLCFTSYKLWSGVCDMSSWDSRWWPLHLLLFELYIRAVVWVWWSVCHAGLSWDSPKLWSVCPVLQVSSTSTKMVILHLLFLF